MRIVLLLAAFAAMADAGPRPNVVFILIDTLRADHLGAYGFTGPISPAIDRLASEGVVFERCGAPAPWTKPSVASLFTSLYPESHGLVRSKWPPVEGEIPATEILAPGATTMAEIFRSAGYRTVGFFANDWMVDPHGYSQGFDVFSHETRFLAAQEAAGWIARSGKAAPFFLYVHLMEAHGPYIYEEKDFRRLKPHVRLPDGVRDEEVPKTHAYMSRTFVDHPERKSSLVNWRAAYAGGVRNADRAVEAVLEALKASGLYEDSVIVLTSDHGEQLGDHGMMNHGRSLHIEELKVPLVVRLPGGRRAGRRIGPWVRLIDVLPTLNTLCDLGEPRKDWAGEDLSRYFSLWPRGDDLPVFSGAVNSRESPRSVIEAPLHLITGLRRNRRRLYDLAADPTERKSLHRNGDAVSRLEDLLFRHLGRLAAGSRLNAPEVPIPEDLQEQLRSLGYLQ